MFAVLSTIFVFTVSLILGLIYSSYDEPRIIFSHLEYLLGYFVSLVGFSSFCIFLGILIKRSAFALGFLLVWFITECYLVYSNLNIPKSITRFLPLESMSQLLIEPFSRLSAIKAFGELAGVKQTKDYDVHFITVLIVVAWAAIFIFSSYKIIQKRDL